MLASDVVLVVHVGRKQPGVLFQVFGQAYRFSHLIRCLAAVDCTDGLITDGLIIDNTINRYSIGDRDNLKFNSDGSLDIYIQHNSPGKDKESNWLLAPKADFNMVLRLYWPSNEILTGDWNPPGVKRVK
ncbi:MAG: DUF1214 domain-containing protein [Deltaproteobacteria bacterium]|nr:DUF1214 domain-containing protein [Deltaproteobacteria bacterium]